MPTSHLLSLPREIRDMIYDYTLASSTGLVIFVPSHSMQSSSLTTYSTPFNSLESRNADEQLVDSTTNVSKTRFSILEFHAWERNEYDCVTGRITLNLLRTCRQIHGECQGRFWKLNRVWGADVGMWKLVQAVKERGVKEAERSEDCGRKKSREIES
jgi:hypothetical protein